MDSLEKLLTGTHCLVTGGAGFIGSNLVRFLLRAGCAVTVLDNFVTGSRNHLPLHPQLTILVEDICSYPLLEILLAKVDFVFHLAAQVGNVKSIVQPESDATTNILGSIRLYHLCSKVTLRKLVYASSSAIFGEAEQMPIDEGHRKKPESFYALSKMAAEEYALLAASIWNVPAICTRFFNVYGCPMVANEYSGVISIFKQRLEMSQPLTIYGDGKQVRDFVYVEDIVRGLVSAAVRGTPGSVYNLGTGRSTTVLELVDTLGHVMQLTPTIEHRDPRPGEVRQSVADISKAQLELLYEPAFSLEKGLTAICHGS